MNDSKNYQIMQYLNLQADLNLDLGVTEAKKDLIEFKEKLNVFNSVHSIKEAKALAKKLFDIKQEQTFIKAGDGYCTITSRKDLLRIVLNTDEELICYNFKKKDKH